MKAYELAKERYAALGIDTEVVLGKLHGVPVSLHCWQGDDGVGFESNAGSISGGGILSTGNHPGRARNAEELRAHLEKALSQIPGAMKVNLHAIYGDVAAVERNAIEAKHFSAWVDWAKSNKVGLDFNPTLYAHEKAADGLTLAHPDKAIRAFWTEHCIRARQISAYFGREMGMPSVMNLWIADGFKDIPADRMTPRMRLMESLDAVFAEKFDPTHNIDTVESKLFGIGLESYTVGSHEFYMGYAMRRGLALCMDAGHYHPTEVISSKISAIALFVEKMLLHVSRPVRWDSDHVVILDEELIAIAQEIVRHDLLSRVHIGLDYFDGSIDRVAAWSIGARNMRKALLIALLEPYAMLQEAELAFDFTKRLMLHEEIKMLPWQAVWEEYCERAEVPASLLQA